MKHLFPFILISFILVGCNKKSSEPDYDSNQQTIKSIEEFYGITLPKDVEISSDQGPMVPGQGPQGEPPRNIYNKILTLNGLKNKNQWSAVFDLETKKMLFDNIFKNEFEDKYLGYGDTLKFVNSEMSITAKTKTHIYGSRTIHLRSQGHASSQEYYFVGEIGSSKIIEYYPDGEHPRFKNHVSPWFKNSVYIDSHDRETNKRTISIVDSDQKIITKIPLYIFYNSYDAKYPVTHTKFFTFPGSSMDFSVVYFFILEPDSYSQNYRSYIPTAELYLNLNLKDSNRLEFKDYSVEGKIVTLIFKVTSFENKITEKAIKIDIENYKIDQ